MVQNWIRGLIAASAFAAVCRQLTPDGPVKKVTALACGVMLLATMFSPLLHADRAVFSYALSDYRQTVDGLTEEMDAREKHLLRAYIEDQTSAYILDEAQKMGLDIEMIELHTKWGDESWIPYEVYLHADASEEQKRRLMFLLDTELGIPPERQHWNEN